MSESTKGFRLGKAAGRAVDSVASELGVMRARQTAKIAQGDRGTDRELNGENVCFGSLTSCENVLRVLVPAGLDPKRIPVLAARMRTGTGASFSPKAEGITKESWDGAHKS